MKDICAINKNILFLYVELIEEISIKFLKNGVEVTLKSESVTS